MEPSSAYLGKKAIDVALAKVEQLFKDAADRRQNDVQRCTKFLEACSEIVLGLNQEYDEILVQAANCPDDAGEVVALRRRIDEYLLVDKLRGKLADAMEGISAYQKQFEESAASVFNWPWKRPDKQIAAREFKENLAALQMDLRGLSEQDLPYRPSGTGIGAFELMSLLRADALSLNALGTKYLAERDKDPMFRRVRQIRNIVESLQREFS